MELELFLTKRSGAILEPFDRADHTALEHNTVLGCSASLTTTSGQRGSSCSPLENLLWQDGVKRDVAPVSRTESSTTTSKVEKSRAPPWCADVLRVIVGPKDEVGRMLNGLSPPDKTREEGRRI